MTDIFNNKNDKQIKFNEIKGTISILQDEGFFCLLVLKVGQENSRNVALVVKKDIFNTIVDNYSINDKVCVKYFITSKCKNGNWYTSANLLDIQKEY